MGHSPRSPCLFQPWQAFPSRSLSMFLRRVEMEHVRRLATTIKVIHWASSLIFWRCMSLLLIELPQFAQELLSTFSTSLGEVALQPSVGGTFVVNLYTAATVNAQDEPVAIQKHLLWDRKAEGGFPGTLPLYLRNTVRLSSSNTTISTSTSPFAFRFKQRLRISKFLPRLPNPSGSASHISKLIFSQKRKNLSVE
jgi:predicted Rdx family selenoprotein